jgi:tellurite resistance protein
MEVFNKLKGILFKEDKEAILNAIIAACAITVYADKEIQNDELLKFCDLLINNEFIKSLERFNIDAAVQQLNDYIDCLKSSYFIGIVYLVDKVKYVNDPDIANLLVKICYLLSHADCKSHQYEDNAIIELCMVLKIEVPNFQDLFIIDQGLIDEADKLLPTDIFGKLKTNLGTLINKSNVKNIRFDLTTSYLAKAIPIIALLLLKYVGKPAISLIDDDAKMTPYITLLYDWIPEPVGPVIRKVISSEAFCSYLLNNKDKLQFIMEKYIEESDQENNDRHKGGDE